jgi:ribosomal protein S21
VVPKKPLQVSTKVSWMGERSQSMSPNPDKSVPVSRVAGNAMITVKVRYNDVEFALRTLKKRVQKSGLLKELRQHWYDEKTSDRRRRQKKANIMKTRKRELDLLGL